MAISVPEYEAQGLSEGRTACARMHEEFVAGVQAEIIRRFMYEPMTEETAKKLREFVEGLASRGAYGTPNVEIDFMADLRGKAKECAGCRGSGSYEEYRIKRAAAGLPDDAGSEKEWRRMASYSDGSATIHIDFIAPENAKPPEISFNRGFVTRPRSRA